MHLQFLYPALFQLLFLKKRKKEKNPTIKKTVGCVEATEDKPRGEQLLNY